MRQRHLVEVGARDNERDAGRRRGRSWVRIGLVSVLVGAAVAVAGPAGAATSKQTVDTEATVRLNLSTCGVSLDPQAASNFPGVYLYDTLLQMDAKKELRPGLATAWTTSKDGLTVTFTLRKGVTFVDGTTFDSASVKATILRGQTQAAIQPLVSTIASVDAPSPDTAVLHMKQPDSTILTTLATPQAGYMISAKAIADKVNLSSSDMGAGSTGYKVVSFTNPGATETVIVERAPGYKYWDPKMWRVKRFELRCGVTDATVKINGLKTGAFDLVTGDGITNADMKTAFASSSNLQVIPFGAQNFQELAFAPKGPLADVAVRTALFQAVDLTTLAKSGAIPGLNCSTKPAPQLFFPNDPGYVKGAFKSPLEYDKAAAEKVLRPLNLNFELTIRAANAASTAEGEYVQAQLKAVGVNVTIRAVPATQMNVAYRSGQLQAMLYATAGNADPTKVFTTVFGPNHGTALSAFATDVQPKLDAVNAFAAGSAARSKALSDLQRFLLSQAWAELFCPNGFSVAAVKNLKGVPDSPFQWALQPVGRSWYVVK
jgi:peptide/nickel transport system substrate-binding protein